MNILIVNAEVLLGVVVMIVVVDTVVDVAATIPIVVKLGFVGTILNG